jgi:hypothetical protein
MSQPEPEPNGKPQSIADLPIPTLVLRHFTFQTVAQPDGAKTLVIIATLPGAMIAPGVELPLARYELAFTEQGSKDLVQQMTSGIVVAGQIPGVS